MRPPDIINTMRHTQNITDKDQVYATIGGTHLLRASEERLEKTIADLGEIGIWRLGASYCTGSHATARLAAGFKDVFFVNNAGTRVTLP